MAAGNIIDYIEIDTTGNATDFGDTTVNKDFTGSSMNGTRGISYGGTGNSTVICYITIATTGDAIDFGDLTVSRKQLAGCSGGGRGVCVGGKD